MAVENKSFTNPPMRQRRFGKKDWDEVRFNFATSLMVDTKLTALAQNLECEDWPLKGESETPSRYIDFTWEELNEVGTLANRPERVDLLVHILRETLSFDEPFGDMVGTVEAANTKEDVLSKNLDYLGIPKDYPLRLCGLSPETIEFCDAEMISTLGGFAKFSQSMAQNVIVGGEFRELLNAISLQDHQKLRKYIPFRPGSKGLHFAESVGILLDQLSENERCSLLKKTGFKLSDAENVKARLTKEQVSQLEGIIVERIRELSKYFDEQLRELFKLLHRGVRLERYFMYINDPEKEAICIPLVKRFLEEEGSALKDSLSPDKKKGFFGRLFGKNT